MEYKSIGIYYGGCNKSEKIRKTFKKRNKLNNTKINHKKYKTIKFSRYLK
jgi:hypothetical protein